MYHSPSSPIPIPPKFSLPLPAKKKPESCKELDKLREQLETCLINESSIITCATPFMAYKACLRKN